MHQGRLRFVQSQPVGPNPSMSPKESLAEYPKALASLSVSFYDSQGYGRGILNRLHMAGKHEVFTFLLI
jgi:hypothetical protein